MIIRNIGREKNMLLPCPIRDNMFSSYIASLTGLGLT